MNQDLHGALREGPLPAADALLGAVLSRTSPEGTVSIRLTEVEAYAGSDDPGSHGFRGRTARNSTMFGPAGHLYAYRIYGIHTCLNVVAGEAGISSAVLLRAGEVVDGVELARARRSEGRRSAAPLREHELARGPGNLVTALGAMIGDDGARFDADPFALEPPAPNARRAVVRGLRVGVGAPGGAHPFDWRLWLDGEASVSRYIAHRSLRAGRH
ncbi:DNA-3-methyladenine glycosylase [Pseudoclavibacter sp. RFBB5]|uniref:DNA-3-methyladenine glycosylase n=1 Tax=Pseudoclavibacter sp. RFBB5 TaxID=2080574 RepID=UPI000CE7D894|nr:DNA-3-methyladenine glycosylase [Pseudoclavibacter sp. RFBB5]PPG30693.1 DNA-3-methyladenine glycosylase [Pseudoclavibacter sp. RFBB5]